jgi:hypothetical protein
MSKEDILLRETINPPLTTKGSEFLYSDLDANWIEIYNQFVLLSQSSQVAVYSAAIEYSIDEYVSYNSQSWKMINGTPQTNITPGTDPLTWLSVYATDMVQAPVIGGATILMKEIDITSAQLLTLNGITNIIELIPTPGAGKYIDIIHATMNLDFNTTYYQGTDTLRLGYSDTGVANSPALWELEQALRAEVSQIRRFKKKFSTYSETQNYIGIDNGVFLGAAASSPTLGDSDIKINLTYQILNA